MENIHDTIMPKLTKEDVDFYDRTGWFISDLIIEDDVLDACIRAAEGMYEGKYETEMEWSQHPGVNFGKPYTDRTQLRVDQFPSFHLSAVKKITHSPEIAAIAGQLLKADSMRYYKDIFIGTPRQAPQANSAIGWHTDISYWPTCIPERMITVYVPLQERNKDNGTLIMVNGSHKWVNRSFNITAEFDDFEKIKNKYEKKGFKIETRDLPHRRGQVSFHSSLVIHATFPNVTDEFQHTVVFGLQANDNRFIPSPMKRFNKNLVVNINDEISPVLPNGIPDIRNQDFYPILWSANN